MTARAATPLIDPFGRTIEYLRLSVTDRCDLRCTYCMAEDMTFLPKREVLSLEELARLARAFMRRGVHKIRLTGGEPLVRRGVMDLIGWLGEDLKAGVLSELTLTTNATQLARFAEGLAAAGVRRLNVSLDSLRPDTFSRVTRGGDLAQVLAGLQAAKAAGLKIKINTVALAADNAGEIPDMVAWAHGEGFDLTLIEVMPMAETGEDRRDQFLPLTAVRDSLAARWSLTPLPDRTGGPARYVRVEETGGRLGFITPLTENFCAGCNRVRVTCTGQLYLCLGRGENADLRAALRDSPEDDLIDRVLDQAIGRKPERHAFEESLEAGTAAVARHMSMTGG
ncbi:MAG: GTP 3',8-cyclase MoaA [Alphaproteobacteria bacterium]